MKIGYIGIGIMGRPMAENLLRAGHTLFIHNRTSSKCDGLAAQGAVVCQGPAEVAANSEVVFLNVPDTADMERVLFGAGGVMARAGQGLIVIDNSTISAGRTRAFAARLKEKGVDYLDAPVSGGNIGARQGTLAIMVGGDREVFEKCRPLLEILGSHIQWVGPVGMGQTCKAINQLLVALHVLACCEGISLAQRSGLDPRTMLDMVSSGAGGSWVLKNLGPRIIAEDFTPGFMIDLLCKDLTYTMELAQEAGQPLMGTSLVQQMFQEARDRGLGREGTQALYKVVEMLSGRS